MTTNYPENVAVPGQGLRRGRALRRFTNNRMAVASVVVLAMVIAVAVLAPLIARFDPSQTDLDAVSRGPNDLHWLGTDSTGRDIFSRLIFAARVSMFVGVAAALLSVVAGALLGVLAGVSPRWLDGLLSRAADVVLSFPTIIVVIVLAGIFGPSVMLLVIGVAITHWPAPFRLVRGVTLTTRNLEYVQAAKMLGVKRRRIIYTHLLPAAFPAIVVNATLAIAQTILLEAALSFLGLGVQPPQASWGNMLTDAQNLTLIQTMPWLWIPPGLAIMVTVLAVNFIGDGLRDALDPRQGEGV